MPKYACAAPHICMPPRVEGEMRAVRLWVGGCLVARSAGARRHGGIWHDGLTGRVWSVLPDPMAAAEEREA